MSARASHDMPHPPEPPPPSPRYVPRPASDAAAPASSAKQAELILRELDALPTLPSVAARLMSLTSGDDADLQEVIKLIEMDPAMTAKVLSLCGRASLGVGKQVTTVDRAVVLLGLHAVQAAVLSVQVVDWMSKMGMGGDSAADAGGGTAARRKRIADAAASGLPLFDHVNFWRHSIAVACAAELIAKELLGTGGAGGGSGGDGGSGGGGGVKPGEAFVAGLMHDLAKPALALALPKAYGRVIELAEQRQSDIAELERTVIGMDHHTAGKRLAERWNLPPSVRDVMWLHGQRCDALPDLPSKRLIVVVGLADALCRRINLGWSGNFSVPGLIDEQCAALVLDPDRLELLIPKLVEELAERSEALGLAAQPGEGAMLQSVLNANRQLGRLNRTLEQRSRAADGRARVLRAIAAFHADPECYRSHEAALAAVAASASALLGEGFYATLSQPRAGGEWLVTRFGPDGSFTDAASLAPPSPPEPAAPADEEAGPAGVADLAQFLTADGSLTLARWLDDHLGPFARGKNLRQVPLAAPGRPATAVLIHDRLLGQAGLDEVQLPALLATWAAPIATAAELERTGSLSEQLANANRVLVETEKRLAEAESMARLGELTAGAAHEMNNPLAVISARAQSLAASVHDEVARSSAAAIVAASQRLADLITRLHAIASPPSPKPGATSVQDLIALIVREAKERTAAKSPRAAMPPVKVVVTGPLPPARLDRELVRRAVLELLVNAIEAGPSQGVEVRVGPDESGDGERLSITIVDTGPGMDERTLQHAFDPFFSQKAAGRQTGLGLPTAKRLIEAHDGTLELHSKQGRGTTAVVRLPAWRWQHEPSAAAAA